MPVAKAFSIEDGDLSTIGSPYQRNRIYKDIDLSFEARPGADNGNGGTEPADIYKVQDAAAVKQAVKNIIMTSRNEKPFLLNFGSSIQEYLFELNDGETGYQIEQEIKQAVRTWEPRARVTSVTAVPREDATIWRNARDDQSLRVRDATNIIDVTVVFVIVATQETVTLTTALTRLR